MAKDKFYSNLQAELDRLDQASSSKRHEKVIERFIDGKAVIEGKEYLIFNSNDYLGLKYHPDLHQAENEASVLYGSGPGAVRFISGTLKVHIDLEKELARFHDKEDAIIFSSAFAANNATLFSLIKPQSGGSLLDPNVLVISDELNHRSIIDGIRLANLESNQKAIYRHLDYDHLNEILAENKGKFNRVMVVTDGVFSMLGEIVDLKKLKEVIDKYENDYPQGILLIVDDSHGVGIVGEKGRGTEEYCNVKSDVLVGTLGKAFGAEGGYVTGPKVLIEYLRETAATYIYSNSISGPVAAAALQSLSIVSSDEGSKLRQKVKENIEYFQDLLKNTEFNLASQSNHPIQPILIGDTAKSKEICNFLYENQILATSINYPVVPKGKDEIRIQINAVHERKDIERLIKILVQKNS